MEKLEKAKGAGSRGGQVIGHTKSGKPIYEKHGAHQRVYSGFSPKDHREAARVHGKLATAANRKDDTRAYQRHQVARDDHRNKADDLENGVRQGGKKTWKALAVDLAVKKALRVGRDGVVRGVSELVKSFSADNLSKLAKAYGDDLQAWLGQFQGTKLYDKAVSLLEQELQLEADRAEQSRKAEEARAKQPAGQMNYNSFWRKQDLINVEKKRLLLKLLKTKGNATKKSHEEELNMAKSNPIADIMKGASSEDADERALRKAMQSSEESSDEESSPDEMSKGKGKAARKSVDPEDDNEDDGDDGSDVTNKGESEIDGDASDDLMRAAMLERGISEETVDKALKEAARHKKGGGKIPARTAAKEEQEGFSSGKKNRGGAMGGNKSAQRPSSGIGGKKNAGSAGNVASYKSVAASLRAMGASEDTISKAIDEMTAREGQGEKVSPKGGDNKHGVRTGISFGPLMTLEKSTGPAGDEEIARHIAEAHGIDMDQFSGK